MNEQQDDVSGVEQEVGAFFAEVREVERAQGDLWDRVAARIEVGEASENGRSRGRRGVRRWMWGAGIAAALVVGAVLVVLSRGDGSPPVSAEEVLERAVAASTAPESVGIRTLVVEQEWTVYYLGPERKGEVFFEGEVRSWYEAPDRQRVEGDYSGFWLGDKWRTFWSVSVWDGEEIWLHGSEQTAVEVYPQDPEGDVYQEGMVLGSVLSDAYDWLVASCRVPRTIEDGEVAGRFAYILELSRPRCGFTFPGQDGKLVIWVDRDTGMVLRSESYAVDGTLSSVSNVTEIEIDSPIAEERFEFMAPPDVEVEVRPRSEFFLAKIERTVQPAPMSLAEARVEATFSVAVPGEVPSGFELESVQHHWGNEMAVQFRSHADWVLLRYVDAEGNWLVIAQGYGGLPRSMVAIAPPKAEQGTVEVGGVAVRWVDGVMTQGWEPGSMLGLTWDVGQDGSAMEALSSGDLRVGSTRSITLASNVLSLEDLVGVAESLE